jgi:signal transduction histidine kinase
MQPEEIDTELRRDDAGGVRVAPSARRWDLIGLAVGAAIGSFDAVLFLLFDADLTLAGRDVTWPVIGLFVLSYGALGFAVGRLAVARERARADARTIEGQLRALEASQRAAAQNEKLASIGRLAAGIAHEVRNPLAVIRSSASMVQSLFQAGEDAYQACEFIREETVRLDGLIRALLDFARPRPLRLETTSLDRVIDRGLQLAAPELERRHIRVERGSDVPSGELSADPDLLSQIVLDLVMNGAEAVGHEGRILVRAGGGTREATLEVCDSGPGVPPEHLEQVFEPFFTTKARGTGLGLAMVARIAAAHGGGVEVVPGRGAGQGGAGACFRVRLPLDPRGAARRAERAV